MAITAIEYAIFEKLRQQGAIPVSPHVLECGEANWYGDVPLSQLGRDIYRHIEDRELRRRLFLELDAAAREPGPDVLFRIARVFWRVFLDPAEIVAIDPGGTAGSLSFDLNHPVGLGRQFDIVLNLGTAEHVFNVFQFFKTVHDHARPGGLMIHGVPFAGWHDHGFYNFQPTFWWDLAGVNGYRVAGIAYAELKPLKLIVVQERERLLDMARRGAIGGNALLYAIFFKGEQETPFRAPIQGYYAGTISEAAREAWGALR